MDVINKPPGLVSIQFLTGPLAGSSIQLNKTTITIGREPTNDVVILDPTVSRHHARLAFDGAQWSIEKLNAQNTLILNKHDVQQLAVIHDRDTIGIGHGSSFLFTNSANVQRSSSPPPVEPLRPPYNSPANVPFGQTMSAAASPPPPSPVASFAPATPQPTPPAFASPDNRGIPSLEISSNVHQDTQKYPLTKQVINIGRDPTNDIVINELVVSAFHAQIVHEGNQLILVHPHPTRQSTLNGLLYQGQHITGSQQFRKPLMRGDIFRIGDEHGTLVTLAFNDGTGAPQDIVPEIHPIPLGAPVISIGRLPNSTVVLDHPQVSGQHARLEQVQGGYRIVDLGSTNHVYVNTQRVTNELLKPGDEIRIGPFKLTYTGTQLTQHDESNSIRIDALHLKKLGNKQTVLINDISIAIPPRKFVALVGGSGTGKSTLMDALNGLRPAQQGAVLYNGQDYYRHLAAFSTQLGYVPQDDIIHRDLTVENALYYEAKLRLPEDFTEAQVKQRINEVLTDVEMTARRDLLVSKLSGGQRKRVSIALELLANPSLFFLDEPTSGLDPGLDRKMMFLLRKLADKGHTIVLVTHATNNINACDYVCFLAQGGRLAYYGPPNEAKTFFGKTDFAEIYSALEPTDEHKDIPAQAEEKFKASPEFQKYVVAPLSQGPAGRVNVNQQTIEIKPPKRGDPWKQFSILSRRYLELLKNDRGNLLILLLQAPVIALILFFLASSNVFTSSSVVTCPADNPQHPVPVFVPSGNRSDCQNVVFALNTQPGQDFLQQKGLTADQALQQAIAPGSGANAQKILFIMAFAAVMFGLINGTGAIVKEAAIYKRERAVNLGIAPYMFSKIAVLGVLCLVQSAILVIVIGLKAPLAHSTFLPPLLEIYITLALTSIAGLMLGLAVSALAPNNDRATSFIPLILIPQVIFSGVIFPLNNLFLKFLGIFFAAQWSMAGMGSSIGLHSDKLGSDDCSYLTNSAPSGTDPSNCPYRGDLFVSISDPAGAQTAAILHLFVTWFALIVMIVILGAVTAYFLKRKDIRS